MSKVQLKPNTNLMPVPVVLVTVQGADEKPNIITLAWVGIVSSAPPQLSISIRQSRFSFALVKSSKEFVVNIPNEDLLYKTDGCGSLSGRDDDKFKEFSLTPVAAKKVKAPLIQECPVNLECKVVNMLDLGSHTMFIAEIAAVHADDDVVKDGKIDTAKVRPIGYSPHEYWSLKEKIGTYGFSQK